MSLIAEVRRKAIHLAFILVPLVYLYDLLPKRFIVRGLLLATAISIAIEIVRLNDRRVRKVREFFEGREGKYARRLSEERTPALARRWRFRMDMDEENFRGIYRKFCGEP